MRYNRLKITTIHAILIACATLTMLACPEPEKPTTDTSTKKGTDTPSFTVTFNPNKGTGDIPPLPVASGAKATKPTDNLTKEDATFGGWYTDEALSIPFFFATETITKDITLHAGWNKRNHYTIRFNTNGGSAMPKEHIKQTIALGKTAKVPPPPPPPTKNDPTLETRTFGGWYTDKERLTPFFFTTKITKNITLYAGWNEPNHYTVRFNTKPAVPEQTIKKDDKATSPDTPTLDGTTLDNWYTDSTFTKVFTFDTPITTNTIIYARWNLAVTFELDGSTPAIGQQTVPSGGKATKPKPNPMKDGYTFAGWYTEVPTPALIPFDFDTPITAPTILYTGWGYTVTFELDGDTPAIEQQTVFLNSKATKPKLNPTKDGYTFAGWYTNSEPTIISIPFDFDTTAINGHITLYAGWKLTVRFNPNGGSVVTKQTIASGTNATKPITLYAGWNVTVSFATRGGSAVAEQTINLGDNAEKPDTPTLDGIVFGGWYTDDTFKTVFKFTTPITTDTTLYAGWKATVTFELDGDTSAIEQQTVFLNIEKNSKATKPKPNPTKDGYTFAGWYTDSVSTQSPRYRPQITGWDTDEELSRPFDFKTAINGHTTLYAGWKLTVTFNLNGGTGATQNPKPYSLGTKQSSPMTPRKMVLALVAGTQTRHSPAPLILLILLLPNPSPSMQAGRLP